MNSRTKMLKLAYIGAFVPLLVVGSPMIGAPVLADGFRTMSGARPILPPRFTPMGYAVVPPANAQVDLSPAPGSPMRPPASLVPAHLELPPVPPRAAAPPWVASPEASLPKDVSAKDEPSPKPLPENPVLWSLPLVDRTLSQAQKAADLAPELLEAMTRIVPFYDPTRLEGPDAPAYLKVSAGTAAMDNVFGDRWRRADQDPNVDVKVRYLAFAWQMKAAPCDAFLKNRAHGFGEPALTALSQNDCALIVAKQARGFADTLPSPIVVAAVSVPVFAAPLPGSRLSSKDFWAAQRARVAAIKAHLAQRYHPAGVAAR